MNIEQRHLLGFVRYALMGGDYPHGLLTDRAWREVQRLAKEQTVTGLLYHTVEQLPGSLRPPQEMLRKLYSDVVYFEQMNELLNERTCQIFKAYKEIGLRPRLLKGPGVASLYRNPEQRMFGDIDIYVPDEHKALLKWIYSQAIPEPQKAGKEHLLSFEWDGATIENHLVLMRFYNKGLAEKMQKILDDESIWQGEAMVEIMGEQIPTLPPTLDLFYQIVHFGKHLISSGVGLRQFCDITRTIHRNGSKMDEGKLTRMFDELEVRELANAVAAAAVRYLGLNPSEVPYNFRGEGSEQQSERLMDLVMDGGNFGFWLRNGKRKKGWESFRRRLRQYMRIYPFMPREVRSEIWLSATGRLSQ